MKYKIKYVDYGIANRYENGLIEINRKLLDKKYKKLYDEILYHEKSHTDKSWTLFDFFHDLKWIKHKGLFWKFVISTPKSWVQFSPVFYKNGSFIFDITLMIFYTLALIILILIFIIF